MIPHETPDLGAYVKKVSSNRTVIINNAGQGVGHTGIELGEDAVTGPHETVKPYSDIVSIRPNNNTIFVKVYGKGSIDGAGYVESRDTTIGSAQESMNVSRVAIVPCNDSLRVDSGRDGLQGGAWNVEGCEAAVLVTQEAVTP